MRRLYPWLFALQMIGCHAEVPPAGTPSAQPPVSKPQAAPGAIAAYVLPEEASRVTFAKMAEFPEPGWQVPRKPAISPDGKTATFLMSEGDSDEMSLFATDLATGTTKVLLRAAQLSGPTAADSVAQELRDERQRKRIKGITEYQWAKKASVFIVPAGPDIFAVQGEKISDLTEADGEVIDPKICADGSKVALVRGSELSLIDVATRKEIALTSKAPAGVTRGLSDFNGQEEFGEVSGHFFTPDCKALLYLEVDERAVSETPILGHRKGKPQLMMQKYPAAGGKNPSVSVLVMDLAKRKPVRVPLPSQVADGAYLGRFSFSSDSSRVVFWAVDRSQRAAHLVLTKLGASPTSQVVHSVKAAKGWVEMTDVVMAPDGQSAYTVLDQGAHRHLARVSFGASLAAPAMLTAGDWDVLAIEGLREDHKAVLVSATKDDPIGQQLYEVSGSELRTVTKEKGVHEVAVSEDGRALVDVWSSLTLKPRAVVRLDDRTVELPVPDDPDIGALELRTPEVVELKAASGDKLYGALLSPRTLEYDKSYPLVVMVYGGPGVQAVRNRWAPRLLWQHLADRGFYVLQVDNRGSANRGPAFEHAIDRRLGEVELADQLAAVEQIVKSRQIDEHRIGIYGHSYGGFLAALAMLQAPERFRAGVAASPVTDWRLYDSGYTERYMGTPADNPAGYDAADLERLAKNLAGDLMIVHALMDENVHFQNTADLVDALVREKKVFEMMVYPGERHGYRSPEARLHALKNVTRFLVRTLGAVDLEAQSE